MTWSFFAELRKRNYISLTMSKHLREPEDDMQEEYDAPAAKRVAPTKKSKQYLKKNRGEGSSAMTASDAGRIWDVLEEVQRKMKAMRKRQVDYHREILEALAKLQRDLLEAVKDPSYSQWWKLQTATCVRCGCAGG